jgi:hypothetical protein
VKVISGLQTGCDFAGIKAAKDNGFETGGYMPKGYRTEKGNKPEYKDLYGALEHSNSDYLGRTLKNVMISDCTIIFDYMQSSGSKNTKMYCAKNNKPYLYLNASKIDSNDIVEVIVNFIQQYQPNILNVAGNRESVCKGIEKKVYNIMDKVFKYLKQ